MTRRIVLLDDIEYELPQRLLAPQQQALLDASILKLDSIETGADVTVAGAGLTKTGTTVDVVAHADGSVTVNADNIQVGILATDAQHGVRGGGTQHAEVVAAGAAGFMSGTDKTKLDSIPGPIEVLDEGVSKTTALTSVNFVGGGVVATNTAGAVTVTVGGSTLSAVGAAPNANAATMTGAALNLEPASASFPGVVVTGDQDFGTGNKKVGSLGVGTVAPSAPSSGVRVFSETQVNRTLPSFLGPNGVATRLQPNLAERNFSWIKASGATPISAIGVLPTVVGATLINSAPSSTNAYTQSVRAMYGMTAAGTPGLSGGIRVNNQDTWRGNASSIGGFHWSGRFGFTTVVADQRWFCGLYNLASNPANANPSTFLNMVGLGADSADGLIYFMHNDGAGAATKVSTGLASAVAGVDLIDVHLYAPANSSSIWMSVEKMNGGSAIVEYEATTDIPANTVFMSTHMWVNNGTTATASSISIVQCIVEKDF